jgi:ParB/RepB/Spo0J family partition protein
MSAKKSFNFDFNKDTNNQIKNNSIRYIKTAVIDDDTINKTIYDDDSVADKRLREEIELLGLAQPILVKRNTKLSERYTIVAGHRRLKAFKDLKKKEIPCMVLSVNDDVDEMKADLLLLTSNMQVRDRTVMERVQEIRHAKTILQKYKANKQLDIKNINEYLADMFGITSSYVKQLTRMGGADKAIQKLVDEGILTVTQGLTLNNKPHEDKKIIVEKLNNASSKSEIKEVKKSISTKNKNDIIPSAPVPSTPVIQEDIDHIFTTIEPKKYDTVVKFTEIKSTDDIQETLDVVDNIYTKISNMRPIENINLNRIKEQLLNISHQLDDIKTGD